METAVVTLVSELSALEISEITIEDKLSDIGIDSLKMVQLIVDVEDHFDIQIKDSDLDLTKLVTVKSIIELVEKYK